MIILGIEGKIKRGALSPALSQSQRLELPKSLNSLTRNFNPTKNIAGLGEIFHRVEGSSKGGAQWDIK